MSEFFQIIFEVFELKDFLGFNELIKILKLLKIQSANVKLDFFYQLGQFVVGGIIEELNQLMNGVHIDERLKLLQGRDEQLDFNDFFESF